MEAKQCVAARGLLGINQDEFAELSGVSVSTIRNYERGQSTPNSSTLKLLRMALEAAGCNIIDPDPSGGVGVRLKDQKTGV